MARKKVNLAWIPNDATRRATFKKRKKGLLKKAYELSTLCSVNTCVVIYGPHDPKPEVWPSQNEALKVLSQFKDLPEPDQCKKMVNQEGFLRQRVEKAREQIRKVEKENAELEMKLLMHEVLSGKRRVSDLSFQEASELERMASMRTREVQHRIDILRSNPMLSSNVRGDEMAIQNGPPSHDEMTILRGGGLPLYDELAILRGGGASHEELANVRGGPVVHDELAITRGEPPSHDELAVEPLLKDWFNASSADSIECTDEMTMLMQPYVDGPMLMQPYVDGVHAWNNYYSFS